jgi:formylglycine-generating enzyme required for sulfatase activity
MDLKFSYGVKKTLAEAFSDEIRNEINELGEYEILSRKKLEKIAKKKGLTQRLGNDDTQCLIDFGRAIGARYVIAGSISRSKPGPKSSIIVNLRLMHTEGWDAGVRKRVSREARTEDELLKSAKAVAVVIMDKKELQGSGQTPKTLKAKIKQKKITNSFGMTFVSIPEGDFMMGSPADEPGRANDEERHWVTISKPFYIQTTEVTQRQWQNVMGKNPSHFKDCGDDCPVEVVSWNDAQAFIKRLNEVEGKNQYRLPTEAEWEYASRARTTTPFFTGNCISTDQANYDGNKPISCCPSGKYKKSTGKVGSLPPNPWGLYDMYGNVWEWCQDWKGVYPAGQVTDPKGPSSGKDRVLRGGSWLDDARNLRSARRFSYSPDFRDYDIGLRVVRDF